jgi:predicted transcriptional regulator
MQDTYVSKLLEFEDGGDTDELIDCVLGLGSGDIKCYRMILENQPTRTDELSDKLDKDESTVHRSVSRLSESGLIIKENVPYENGGYRHEYTAEDPEDIARYMKLLISEWAKVELDAVDTFEEEFEDNSRDH